MKDKILNTVNSYNMFSHGDTVVIGVSGGADSIFLLYMLNDLQEIYNLKLYVVHINHLIRGAESLRDENFVKNTCKTLKIEYFIFNIDVIEFSKKEKLSEEEAGRIVRYNTFQRVINHVLGNKIALGHNANDNAETILMRMVRGTGLKGLTGIPAKRDNIVRPLIKITRKEIEEYLHKNKIEYMTDSTNQSYKYTRNIIRKKIISIIEKELNVSFVRSMIKMSDLLLDDLMLLDEIIEGIYREVVQENNELRININKLKENSNGVQKYVVKKVCSKIAGTEKNISEEHINIILSLKNKTSGKEVKISNNIVAKRVYEYIVVSKEGIIDVPFAYDLNIDKELYIKEIKKYVLITDKKINNKTEVCTIELNYDKLKNIIKIRSRQQEDKIRLNGKTKKIKKYFIDTKVEKDERNRIPLLAKDKEVIVILKDKCIVNDNYKTTNEKTVIYVYMWGDKNAK